MPTPPAMNGNALTKKDEKIHKNGPLIGIDVGGTGIKGGIVDLKKASCLETACAFLRRSPRLPKPSPR